jgi:hypothetical protein
MQLPHSNLADQKSVFEMLNFQYFGILKCYHFSAPLHSYIQNPRVRDRLRKIGLVLPPQRQELGRKG